MSSRRSPLPSTSTKREDSNSENRRRRSRSPPPSRSSNNNNNNSDNNNRRRSRSRSPARNDQDRRRNNDRRENYRRDDRRDRDYRDDRDDREDRDRRGGGERERRDDNNRKNDRDSRPSGSSSSSSGPKQIEGPIGGDGGWGSKSNATAGGSGNKSPGRPSLALPSQTSLSGTGDGEEVKVVKVIEPNFGASGALAAETNTFQGVVLKYNEPPEARKPVRSWRLYVFKGKEQVDLFHVHRQSAYLFGRDRVVVDIPIDHPSASKQHAVLQFRQVFDRNEFGDTKSLTKPFIIDLDSANGTAVNDEQVPTSRYYELKSNDIIKFAFSTREYVLIAES